MVITYTLASYFTMTTAYAVVLTRVTFCIGRLVVFLLFFLYFVGSAP